MSDIDALLAAKTAADTALADAEAGLQEELVAAKDAHRAAPNLDTKARKDAAVAAIQTFRCVVRKDRVGVAVGGDAFVIEDQQSEG